LRCFIERPTADLPCSGCGEIATRTFHHSLRRLRDLSVFDKKAFLVFDEYRVDCPRCGYKVEKLPFAAPWARVTMRFAEYVALMVRHSTVKEVADMLGLDWETVKEIDKAHLKKEFGEPDFDGLRILCLDEISRKKRHKYFTVAMNYEKTKVIWRAKTASSRPPSRSLRRWGRKGAKRSRRSVWICGIPSSPPSANTARGPRLSTTNSIWFKPTVDSSTRCATKSRTCSQGGKRRLQGKQIHPSAQCGKPSAQTETTTPRTAPPERKPQ